MPDIDIDFPDYRRDEVIQYMVQKYGSLHAAQIVTFGTLSAKAALRDTGRVFGLDSDELSRLSALVPSGAGKSIAEADLTNWRAESAVHERVYGVALQLEGLPRHTSTHAAGMVLSQAPLTDHVPIMSGGEGVYMTQYAMGPLQKTGLLKMDLLGLRNLTTIERILSAVKRLYKKQVDLHEIDLHDPAVMTIFSEGKTAGLFQFESAGMKNVLTKLMPERFEDLVAVNALYRPGPMEQIPLYIERRHNRQPVPSIHPVLDTILAPTYGLIVYQEQIIRIAVEFAGYTPGEADLLRRAVSKKQKDVLEQERVLFLQKSAQKNVPGRVAQDVYDVIVRFADYGFNRSHAVAYSMIGYWLAWLKTHYPACFFAALMQTQAGNETKMQQLKTEARSMNLVFSGPDVNKSESGFTAEKNGVRFGFTAIKGVNRAAAKDIVDRRRNQGAYKSLFDFCARLQNSQVTRPVMEALIWSGAMDEFGQSRESLHATLDSALDYAELFRPGDDDFMKSFGVSLSPAYATGEVLTAVEKLEREKALLGSYVSAHPIESFRPRLTRVQCRTADAVQSARLVYMGGMIGDVREIRTKKGDKMAFSMLSDETGEIEVVLFPDVYRSVMSLVTKGELLLLTGAAEERNGRLQLVVKQAVELEKGLAEKEDAMRTLFVRIASGPDESRMVERLYDQLLSAPGFTPVVLHYERTGETVRLSRKYHVSPHETLLREITAVCGRENVVLKGPAFLYNPS